MKRFFFLAASISILAACSGLEQPEFVLDAPVEGDIVKKVVFDVLPIKDGDVIETKASAIPNGGVVAFGWEATDTVAIFPDSGSQVYFTIDESNVGKSTASFDGGGWALKSNHTYISCYPFVGDIYLKRNKIPVSFTGQKQIGTSSPFSGARYFLAADPATSENGVLRFSYNTLNTIINVNATLPAGTYTKASLTVSDPLFVEEGTYSLDDQTIVGTKYSTTLKIDLEDVTLTRQGTIPIYFMSAPVDLKNKEVTIKIISSDGKKYECVKTPSKTYEAGTRYGLTCDNMQQSNAGNIVFADANIKAALVAAFDTEEDGELSYMEAAAVTSIEGVFGTKKTYTSFDEFQYFTGVTSIPNSMFEGWQIASIRIPESIVWIGNNAFQSCVKLQSISIPNSVRSIESSAFLDCSGLKTVELSTSLEGIRPNVFNGCSSLSNIVIPNSVSYIGLRAFKGCSSLVSVVIPEGLPEIYNEVFYGCSSLTSITIPDSVTSIGQSAFRECRCLSNVNIPESVTSIGASAFLGCSLTSVTIPDGMYKIENSVFQACVNLSSVLIPESIISIGSDAFAYCSSLTSLTLPESLESIGAHAFQACTGLTSITIPDGVLKINDFTFNACSALTSITLPESVTSIGGSAFYGCSSLTNITILGAVTNIGASAFCGCSSLLSVTIPESVSNIEEGAFSDCSSLTSIAIPESVTIIEGFTFAGCTSLTNITLPESVISIEDYAFANCSSFSSITIPDSVTRIGCSAFRECENLTSIICLANTPPSGVDGHTFYKTNGCGIYVPASSVNAYKTADGWSDYADRIYSTEGGYVPPVDDGGDD